MAVRVIGMDTETALIQPGRLIPPLVCMTYYDPNGPEPDPAKPKIMHVRGGGIIPLFLSWLADPDVIIAIHNAPFDLAVLVEEGDRLGRGEEVLRAVFKGLDEGKFRCSKIAEQLWHIYHGTLQYLKKGALTLLALVEKYAGVTINKGEDTWRLRYWDLVDTPIRDWPKDAIDYAVDDAVWHLVVRLKQVEEFERLNYLDPETRPDGNPLHPFACVDEVRQLQAAFALHLQSAWGIRTDLTRVQELAVQLAMEIESYKPQLEKLGIFRDDGTKNMKLLYAAVEDACAKAGIEVPRTPTGKPATDGDTFTALQDTTPALGALSKSAHAKKILTTFVTPAMFGTRYPINSSFNTLVMTGRPSSARPNLYNQPRGWPATLEWVDDGGVVHPAKPAVNVRRIFTAREGCTLSSTDYGSAELRALAQVCHALGFRSNLRQMFIDKIDPLTKFGARLARMDFDEFKALKKTDQHAYKEKRQRAKALLYGRPGGLGAKTFITYARGYGVLLTLPESKALIQEVDDEFPELPQYFAMINSLMEGEGGGFGTIRQFWSGRIRGHSRYTALCNSFFQGLVSDIIKRVMYRVCKECYLGVNALDGNGVPWGETRSVSTSGAITTWTHSPLLDSRVLVTPYDELLAEHPTPRASDGAKRIEEIMVKTAEEMAPDVPWTAEAVLMNAWEKEAEPRFDDDGNLMAWDSAEGGG